MVPLAAANVLGAVLFGTLYAVAGAHRLPQWAFVLCFVGFFALVTACWVRAEGQQRMLDPLGRLGRGAIGLGVVLVGLPAVVLMPFFWLDTQLPTESGIRALLGPVMAVLLISLVLVVLVNVAGVLVITGRALAGRLRPRPPSTR